MALVASALIVSAAGLVMLDQRLLVRAVDETLIQRADNVEADVARGAFPAALRTEGDLEDSFMQIIDGDGLVLAATTNVASLPAVTNPFAPGSKQTFRTVSMPPLSEHKFRVLGRAVPSTNGTNTLIVAKNLDDVTESVNILVLSLAISIPVAVSLLAAVVWWLMGRALDPVEAIRAEVSGMQGADLHRRVPVRNNDDEISRLARTMNDLLDRVEQATERQREFVADASHELRGPLTRLRSVLEVSIAHPAAAEPEATYRSVLSDIKKLQELVDDLLFLARSESGRQDVPEVSVDLDDLVLEEVRELRARGRIRVDASAVSAARVRGDAKQLKRAISNLVSNAERHAATTIRFELRESDGQSELVIADDGPGIPEEQRDAVLQRFTRLDDARSRDSGGAGLGLAIVHDIVARHSGTISIGTSETGGARMILTFARTD
ncbi:MAG TPA: HAMP domain-containing sensor histidine kinase [Propionibacteriaceae bacterium]|nr:HAMP domain-containing sensor histidine kinase [Propionibacteriaceae bacterium]